jgi:hypothetical protein
LDGNSHNGITPVLVQPLEGIIRRRQKIFRMQRKSDARRKDAATPVRIHLKTQY